MFVEDRDAWEAEVVARQGPVVQGWDWGAAKALAGHPVWRVVLPSGAALQAVGTRFHGVPVAWAAGGPILRGGQPSEGLGRQLRRLACRLRRPVVLAPHAWSSLRRAAPVGCPSLPAGTYLPATVMVDLDGGRDAVLARLHRTWRNHYRTGARRCSRVELDPSDAGIERVASLFRAGSGTRAPDVDDALLRALANAFGPRLSLSVASDESGDVGAAVVLSGSAQALLLGLVTTPEGRGRNGANLLVFEAMAAAATEGIRTFDLGGISGVDDGIAHFKLRTNGTVVEHARPFVALPVPW